MINYVNTNLSSVKTSNLNKVTNNKFYFAKDFLMKTQILLKKLHNLNNMRKNGKHMKN